RRQVTCGNEPSRGLLAYPDRTGAAGARPFLLGRPGGYRSREEEQTVDLSLLIGSELDWRGAGLLEPQQVFLHQVCCALTLKDQLGPATEGQRTVQQLTCRTGEGERLP